MCGIIGYVGEEHALPHLLEGLRTLEYRGYDSVGVTVSLGGEEPLLTVKTKGKLRELTNARNCAFVLWVGNKRLIKKRLFDQYIEQTYSI